jgi:hypothetical protein
MQGAVIFLGGNMIFKVTGSKSAVVESTNQAVVYYVAPAEEDVRKALLKDPIDKGGFTSFKIETLEELPPESGIVCPHCKGNITDERKVVHVGMGIGRGTTSSGEA